MNANDCCCPPLQSPCEEDADIELDCLKCLDIVFLFLGRASVIELCSSVC